MENIPFEKIRATLFAHKKSLFITGLCTALLAGNIQPSFAALPQEQKITLNVRNITVKDAIETIKKQSGYSFFIDTEDVQLHKQISVNLNGKSVSEALNIIFSDQPVKYEIKGKHVIVTGRETSTRQTDTSKMYRYPVW